MRILMIHNSHQFIGGDDVAADQEIKLLQKYGHIVEPYYRNNTDISDFSIFRKTLLFFEPTWSWKSYKDINIRIQNFQPDIVHCQGFFPLVSPAIYDACIKHRVPIVQTLHDYRLLCPVSTLMREGRVCEDCLTGFPLSAVVHHCYRDSRLQTASVVSMLSIHRALKTWQRKVNLFLTPSEFARHKFIEGGLDPQKILVRPNFLVDDPGESNVKGKYALYVGRLAFEKGIDILLSAWKRCPNIPLKIVGDGPLYSWAKNYIKEYDLYNVELLGFQSLNEVIKQYREALFVIFPSIFYETFGRIIMEAYATGTPVIASNIGALAELVKSGETGLLFSAGNVEALEQAVQSAISNPDQLTEWGKAGRHKFEQSFTAEIAYQQLLCAYQRVLQ
jgi:glycosyltransferase involved in cell wall biosynthesis